MFTPKSLDFWINGTSVEMGIICEKCGKIAMYRLRVPKDGKYGEIRYYDRFRHYLGARKTTGTPREMKDRFKDCYVRVKA